ncbi:MAG TPA: response regulator transcription factor, partial [Chloroflexota bacterium]|nr:response regulator transcription factor [Chloroflexota bacterium]
MMRSRVLVVEDELKLVRLVRSLLEVDGYDVITAATGEDALDIVELAKPDLVLLDLLLPGDVDGYEVCRRIRTSSRVPVIMLTAKAQESDKVRGFDLGADDYITKPFSSRELLARVKAVLRRSSLQVERVGEEVVRTGSLSVDLGRRRVTLRGREVLLTPTEYNLLAELARNAGKVMLHEELLARVWGPEYREEAEYLRAYVRYLRRKLEED